MSKKFKVSTFIFGGLIGAGAALLLAPRKGEETRAIVADKVGELFGQGQTFYARGAGQSVGGPGDAQAAATSKNDELREKIEKARMAIADQVAKNAAAARDTIADKVPIAGERITQAVDVVRGQIDAAASRLRHAAVDAVEKGATAKDAAVAAGDFNVEVTITAADDAAPAAGAGGEAAGGVKVATDDDGTTIIFDISDSDNR
jgi:gas vesicle protein